MFHAGSVLLNLRTTAVRFQILQVQQEILPQTAAAGSLIKLQKRKELRGVLWTERTTWLKWLESKSTMQV